MNLATALIVLFEGFHGSAYLDPVGIPTIGYGSTTLYGREVVMTDTVTEREASVLLTAHASSDYVKIVDFGQLHGYGWTQQQVEALTSFTYNVGWENFLQLTADGTRSNEEIAEKMPLYRKAKGVVFRGLERRRRTELCAFQSETYSEAFTCIGRF